MPHSLNKCETCPSECWLFPKIAFMNFSLHCNKVFWVFTYLLNYLLKGLPKWVAFLHMPSKLWRAYSQPSIHWVIHISPVASRPSSTWAICCQPSSNSVRIIRNFSLLPGLHHLIIYLKWLDILSRWDQEGLNEGSEFFLPLLIYLNECLILHRPGPLIYLPSEGRHVQDFLSLKLWVIYRDWICNL